MRGIHEGLSEIEKRADERCPELARENEALRARLAELERIEGAQGLLAEASRVLVSSLNLEAMLRSVARLAVPTLADWCLIDAPGEDGAPREFAVASVDHAQEEASRRHQQAHPPEADRSEAYQQVLEEGRPLLVSQIGPGLPERLAQDAWQLGLIPTPHPRSFMVVPLPARGRILGAISFAITGGRRRFDQADLALAEALAERTALAIANARLYHQVQTAQAAAERRLAETDSAFSAITDGLVIYNLAGELVRMNPTAERLQGLTPEQRKLPFAERIRLYQFRTVDGQPVPPEELPMTRALQHGETVEGTLLVTHRPTIDECAWVLVSAAPIVTPEGRQLGAVATFTDLTPVHELQEERERLLAEVQRRASELDATLASIGDALMIFDRTGELVRINARTMELLNVPMEYVGSSVPVGWQNLRVETPTGKRMPVEEIPTWRALHGETVRDITLVLHPERRGEMWATGSAAPICTPEGEILGAVVTFTDVTALHELQEQMEDLLRAVSHDLRNPLQAVLGPAQLLERRLAKAGLDREREDARTVVAAAQRMDTMIQDLVDAARSESGQIRLERRPVDLQSFALDLKQRLAPSLETVRIEIAMPAGLPSVSADPTRLERILTNLWSNALKYSAPGTPIVVRARQEGDAVITSVTDRGRGIPPEELPHIFERYYRARATQEAREGLGLGLHITRRLVEAHGGSIWVESEPGVGSTFSFSLPVTL